MANIPTANNNPGDLKDPQTGQFMTFNSPQEGFQALKNDLQDKISGATSTGLNGNSTLQQFSSVWAPSSDGNNPDEYAQNLASQLGVAPTAPLASLNVSDLANAIAKNEGYQGPADKQLTMQQFAEKIKQKYPQYASLDDNTLAQKVLAKYPQYAASVEGANQGGSPSGLPNLPSAAQPGQSGNATPGLPALPSAAQIQSTPTSVQPTQPKSDLMTTAENILTSLFPGSKTLGEYLGTKLAQLEAGPNAKYVDTSGPTGGQALAAAGELGLEGASFAIPGAGGALGRIGTQAALGAGIGGLNALATGGNVAGGAALGGLAGGTVGGAVEGLGALANFVPKSIIQARFPNLSEDAAQALVDNAPIGTATTIKNGLMADRNEIGEQLGEVLQNPQYADRLVNGQEILGRTVAGDPSIPKSGLPNAGATTLTLRKAAKALVGGTSGDLIDRLFPADGSVGALNLQDAHSLSSDLGGVIGNKFNDLPSTTQNKKIAAQLYFALTGALKDNAPEAEPLLSSYSQKTMLINALGSALKKSGRMGLTDWLTLIAGIGSGNPLAGVGLLAGKKALQSPTTDILAAKGLAGLGRGITSPATQAGTRFAGLLGSAYAQPALNYLTR